MKTVFILTFFSFCLIFTAQAQDKTYVPNARQAVQKSRMQQPQYFEVTKEAEIKPQGAVKEASKSSSENYQKERLVAIDAPKRRGKKSGESSFARLAANSKQ